MHCLSFGYTANKFLSSVTKVVPFSEGDLLKGLQKFLVTKYFAELREDTISKLCKI